MRIKNSAAMTTGVLALGLTLSAAAPAVAGAVCNDLDRSSPCITSTDLKSRLDLNDGKQGRLRVMNSAGASGVELNASNGNLTNLFDNSQNKSNGLVKAWAQINADGTIAACWRCNTDTNETRRITDGQYEVDFTPLATDISGRPRTATVDIHGGGSFGDSTVTLADRASDPSSVFARTHNTAGAFTDAPFILIVY
jgi:hypothetical protein